MLSHPKWRCNSLCLRSHLPHKKTQLSHCSFKGLPCKPSRKRSLLLLLRSVRTFLLHPVDCIILNVNQATLVSQGSSKNICYFCDTIDTYVNYTEQVINRVSDMLLYIVKFLLYEKCLPCISIYTPSHDCSFQNLPYFPKNILKLPKNG